METIVVTGASRGIGHYLANKLVESGFYVIGIARSFPQEVDFETICCDVSQEENVKNSFSNFKKNKNIYGLINCAGVLRTSPVVSVSELEIDEIIDTNLKGTIFCCKHVIRPLIGRGEGRIINFSSIAANIALRGDSVYSASKSAVQTFSKAFAKEVADRSITVNCIAPGVINTDMTSHLTREQVDELLSLQTIKKQATIEDIWHLVKFLLAYESRMVTGQIVSIGG